MNSPIKILVIEDSPADFLLLERHVQQHGMTAEFRCVNSDVELDAALQSDWDIVLSDYNVPSMDFRGTLRRIQEKRPNLPIILVSGTIGDEVAVELLHLGLSDFVLKDRLARLPEAIQHTLTEVHCRRVHIEAQLALIESEEKYRQLFDSSRDALILASPPSWQFTQANLATLQLFGVSSMAEFAALGPLDVSPERQPDGRLSSEKTQEMRGRVLRDGSHFFEWKHRRLNGQPFTADVLLTRIDTKESQFILATVRDITERKQIEETLRKERDEQALLIKKLEEAHNHLLQSDKMASIGQLAAGVAHEINNPIGYVSSNLGTLEQYLQDTFAILSVYEQAENSITDPIVREEINAAKKKLDIDFLKKDLGVLIAESRDGITRVKKIVQNLKDFAHVDVSEEWHFSNLHKGLDSTLNIVNNEIKYKAEVIKKYGDIPEVECLASQINQVFMNLLVNAAHAIEERGVITVSTGTQGEEVWVSITDTGSGIEPGNLKKIFDPFFTTKPLGKGTGLGLSLSYSIIHKHHGRIEVQSEVGKGTTFCVWLPIKQTQAVSDE